MDPLPASAPDERPPATGAVPDDTPPRPAATGRKLPTALLVLFATLVAFQLILSYRYQDDASLQRDEASPHNATNSTPPNPTLLSPNMTRLWFVGPDGRRFEIPTNIGWVRSYRGLSANGGVDYLTEKSRVRTRGLQGNCTGALEVFRWINRRVRDEDDGCLMVAYGGLLHAHREKDLVNARGKFIDDDIDTWASPGTFAYIATLETELFLNFGWTIRRFVHGGFVVLAQIVATCGHAITTRQGKATSSQPAIELYPTYTLPRPDNTTQHDVVKDIWQNVQFLEPTIFPARRTTLNSSVLNEPLELQYPNRPLKVLECLYGNWKVPSGQHASPGKRCLSL